MEANKTWITRLVYRKFCLELSLLLSYQHNYVFSVHSPVAVETMLLLDEPKKIGMHIIL